MNRFTGANGRNDPMSDLGFEIGRYRTRAVEVTMTEPLTADNRLPILRWIEATGGRAELTPEGYEVALVVHTLEGEMDARYGDRIVFGTRNEHYPIKPGPFADKYEEIVAEPLVADDG